MLLRHVVIELSGGGPGDEQTCVRVFPGIISAQKVLFGEIPTCASLELAEEGGADTGPGEAAESCKSAPTHAALEGGCAAGATADRFAQVERHVVGLAGAAEGNMWLGVSTVEQMCMVLGAWWCPALLPSQ